MINAVNNSFLAMNNMEFGLPIWKYIMTPTMRQLFEAQDFFTEYIILGLIIFFLGTKLE
jgi:hypothetical protein